MSVPHDHQNRPVAVIGAGTLGRRIALTFATRGGTVRITDPDTGQRRAAVDYVRRQLDELADTRGWVPGRAEPVSDERLAVDGAWLVEEVVPERLELKRSVFRQAEAAAARDAILATNSSSFSSRHIVEGLSTTDRMLNTHFYMPPDQVALDVMSCGNTSDDVLDFVLTTFPHYGLRPFLARRESTGFIFNRIWAAIKRESLEVMAEGVSVPADIDAMFTLMFGSTVGPFRMMDAVGLDVVYDIERHYADENPHLPTGPRELLRGYVDAGKLGAKSGAGFYADYR